MREASRSTGRSTGAVTTSWSNVSGERTTSGVADVDVLYAKVGRSGTGTMGMFLSINGWSDHVPGLLKQNREKSIILADGYDLHLPLIADVSLRTILDRKIEALRTCSEPFFSARNLVF